ncbi:MAG: chemotaxis protein CheD [Candidatus Omnitrophota bacterium]|nr:MAG: chemotaxis protein CheD [Candidatus Omnitrophota bacterium]
MTKHGSWFSGQGSGGRGQQETVTPDRKEIAVGMADIKIGKAPAMISTILGSCIAVCLYSSKDKTGGLLHLMMASSKGASKINNFKKAKYADTGILELLGQLKNFYGLNQRSLVAKIFGGAKVLKNVTAPIGENNQQAVKEILKENGIAIFASKLGGEKGYRIKFDLETGKVKCQIFGHEFEEY